MKRTTLTVALTATVLFVGAWMSRPQAQTEPVDVITAGCNIPKSYGRLVSTMPGQPGGAAAGVTYAVFEAEDGTIRWVATAPAGIVANTQAPPRGQLAPAFINRFECMLGSEWKRH